MKRIVILSAVFVCAVLLPWGLSPADTVGPVKPGSVKEQDKKIPPEETSLTAIWEDLESDAVLKKEGALLWLLRRNNATDLGYYAFPTKSIRFGVERVRKIKGEGITWCLAECKYQSRLAERSGHAEYRAIWSVAYLFDDLGHLRDWVDDYDVLFLEDLNRDGNVELFAYIDSPKRAFMYSYERGRSREVLRVDDVPEGATAIGLLPETAGSPRNVEIAAHGTYAWDKRAQRYSELGSQGKGK